METRKRFKMYKSGKKWLVAGIIAGGMATVGTVGNAHADEVTVQTEQVSSAAQPTSEAASTSSSATAASSVASSSAVSSVASSSASSVASSAVSEASSSAASAAASSTKDVETAATKTVDENVQYKPADGAKIVGKGQIGTSKWELDSNGNVYVYAGDLSEGSSPAKRWGDDQVKVINVNKGVKFSDGFNSRIFANNKNLEAIKGAENFDFSNTHSLDDAFSGNPKLKEMDVSNWNLSHVTNLGGTFSGDSSLSVLDVSNWDTSKVTDMNSLFKDTSSLSVLDVSNWDMSKVIDMNSLFENTSSLKVIDVSNWDTEGLIGGLTPKDIFADSGVEKLDLSNWKTDKFILMRLAGIIEAPNDFMDNRDRSKNLWSIKVGPNVRTPLGLQDRDKNIEFKIDGKTYVTTGGWYVANSTVKSEVGKTYSADDLDRLIVDGKLGTAEIQWAHKAVDTDEGKTNPDNTNSDKTNPDNTNSDKTGSDKTNPGNTNADKTDSNKTNPDNTNSKQTDVDKTNTNKSQSKDNQSKESTTDTDQKQESKKNTTVVAAKSNDNSSSNNGDVVTTTVTNNASSSEKRQSPQFMKGFLPQTGENNTTASILTVVGVALAGLLASFGIAKKSRKH